MSGEQILHLPALPAQAEPSNPIKAFGTLLPPPSPLPSPALAPSCHEPIDHVQEEDNTGEDDTVEADGRVAALGDSSHSLVMAGPHNLSSTDQNHKTYSINPALPHLPLASS